MSRTDYVQIKSTLESEVKTKVFKGIFLGRRRQTLREIAFFLENI